MPIILFVLLLGIVAWYFVAKKAPVNRNDTRGAPPGQRKPTAKVNAQPFVSPFDGEPDHYIPHSEAEALEARCLAQNPTMSAQDVRSAFQSALKARNERFIELEKVRCKNILSNVVGKTLDEQQIRAVLTNDDATLVAAGAGSGKTTVLAGKVKYLTEGLGVDPDKILLLSFTTKAAGEMTERIRDKMGIPIAASTFHKLGLEIIRSVSDKPVTVFDDTTGFIRDFFDRSISTDDFLCGDLLEFFAFYLHPPADMALYEEAGVGAAFDAEMSADFETLKSKVDRAEFIRMHAEENAPDMRTLQGEKVKSLQELTIANFLFLHSINYEYEQPYTHQEKGEGNYTTYRPDFYLPDYDIWLEHYGTDRYGRCPWLSRIEEQKYIEKMRWKRSLHAKHGTTLLETYSWYVTDGILLSRLETMLRGHGVKFCDRSYEDIFRTVYGSVSERYFGEFITLCSTFLSLFKAGGYVTKDLDALDYKTDQYANNQYHTDRTALFKNIMRPLLEAYDKYLQEHNAVDFSDMINTAARYIRERKCTPQYSYVLVDEYQDASIARFELVKALHDVCGCRVMAVGDDWQSIYRFSGSDISVFTDFAKFFDGHASMCKIETTYRNSQDLIDVLSDFVLTNPNQLVKSLRSAKQLSKPLVFISYEGNPGAGLKLAMDRIIAESGVESSVLLLGRTRYDLEILRDSGLFAVNRESVTYLESPETPVTFLTVHGSKGLEGENVVLLNNQNTLMGFPNKLADDILLQLVLSSADSYPYAEERRLFYVALSRTRNRTYVLTNDAAPSEFYREFVDDPNCELITVSGEPVHQVSCPYCKTGHLVIRKGKKDTPFLGCSHYPKCDYTVKDITILRRKHAVCPACNGFLSLRHGKGGNFYGCTNFPRCHYTIPEDEYNLLEYGQPDSILPDDDEAVVEGEEPKEMVVEAENPDVLIDIEHIEELNIN